MTVVHPQAETRVEYAVRYDAPAEYAGLVNNIDAAKEYAEWFAAAENDSRTAIRCTVVRRTVTYGEWEPVSD